MDFHFEIDTKGALKENDQIQQQNEGQEPTESGSILSKLREFKQSLESKYNLHAKGIESSLRTEEITSKNKNKFISKQLLKEMKAEDEPKRRKEKKKELKNVNTGQTVEEIQKEEARKVLKKSMVLNPEFENLKAVPSYEVSKRQELKERKIEREKTKGKNWFNLPATEMTDEVKRDLEVLQMRSVLDPKHFYKKNDLRTLPKYFQVGKVLDSPLEFYSGRLTKKERKKTLVDELLANAEFQKYNKRKYKEIIEEKQKTHYKAWRQAKRLKKRT